MQKYFTQKPMSNKLYTEEEVKRILKSTHIHTDNDVDMILRKFSPIELPSDEEIESKALETYQDYPSNPKWHTDWKHSSNDFTMGAKWMRDKIKRGQYEQ